MAFALLVKPYRQAERVSISRNEARVLLGKAPPRDVLQSTGAGLLSVIHARRTDPRILPGKMENHTDEEMSRLERLAGRPYPF